MSKAEFLSNLADLSDSLVDLELDGEGADQRDRLVQSISDLTSLITRNALKEGTVALENAIERLDSVTAKVKDEQESLERSTRNLQAVTGVLGAIAGVIRFF